MPSLGLLGYWPSYLSFSLYSENTPEATVYMDDPGGQVSVTEIAYERLNAPDYSSQMVYDVVGERACDERMSAAPRSTLVIQRAPGLLSGSRESRTYTCRDLAGSP